MRVHCLLRLTQPKWRHRGLIRVGNRSNTQTEKRPWLSPLLMPWHHLDFNGLRVRRVFDNLTGCRSHGLTRSHISSALSSRCQRREKEKVVPRQSRNLQIIPSDTAPPKAHHGQGRLKAHNNICLCITSICHHPNLPVGPFPLRLRIEASTFSGTYETEHPNPIFKPWPKHQLPVRARSRLKLSSTLRGKRSTMNRSTGVTSLCFLPPPEEHG